MKILHINTYDTGGAANACLRIHRSLIKKGVDSKMLVLDRRRSDPSIYSFNYWNNTNTRLQTLLKGVRLFQYERKLRRLSSELPANNVGFSFPSSIFDITEHPLYKEADIIQLNWVSGFLDETSFFKKNTKPVIWRMADLYIIGGGNHYEKNFPFEAYKKYIEKNYATRKKNILNKDINIVAISNWTKQKALDSELLQNKSIRVIHNGIDDNVFRAYDRDLVRELLGLPKDKKIILFGAQSLTDPRKGYDLLLKSIANINIENVYVCAFGESSNLDKNIHQLGSINDERLLAMLYSAVDLFLMTSIEETFGQVTIEALACGTPVVSFPNGGSIDIIKPYFNGILTDDFTSQSLAKSINQALDIAFDRTLIIKDTLSRFNINDKAEEYIDLYRSILNRK